MKEKNIHCNNNINWGKKRIKKKEKEKTKKTDQIEGEKQKRGGNRQEFYWGRNKIKTWWEQAGVLFRKE